MRVYCQRNVRILILLPFLLLLGIGAASGQDREPLEESIISLTKGGQLVESVGNLPDWPEEGWDGFNDEDIESWNGTVTVFNIPPEGGDHPWGIFAFKDEKIESIGGISFFMITAVLGADVARAGKDFLLEVSTGGTDEADFEIVLEDIIEIDINVPFADQEWAEFTFDSVRAKYIKLTFLSNYGDGTYTTFGEIAIYGGEFAVSPLEKSPATWGEIKGSL